MCKIFAYLTIYQNDKLSKVHWMQNAKIMQYTVLYYMNNVQYIVFYCWTLYYLYFIFLIKVFILSLRETDINIKICNNNSFNQIVSRKNFCTVQLKIAALCNKFTISLQVYNTGKFMEIKFTLKSPFHKLKM